MSKNPNNPNQPVGRPTPAPEAAPGAMSGDMLSMLQENVAKRFSIGGLFSGLFWTAVFVGIAYFVFRIPQVQEWIGKHLPDDIKSFLNDKLGDKFFPGAAEDLIRTATPEDLGKKLTTYGGLEPTMANAAASIITNDREAFITAAKEVGNGKVTLTTLKNPETVRQFITTQLAKPEARTMMLQAVAQAAPFKVDAQKLNLAVTAIGIGADGKPTAALSQTINQVLAAGKDKTAITSALVGFLVQPAAMAHGKELFELLQTIETDDKPLRAQLAPLKNYQTFQATVNLMQKLPEAQAQQLANALVTKGGIGQVLALMNSDATIKNAVLQFTREADLASFPEDTRKALVMLRDTQPDKRDAVLVSAQRLSQNLPENFLSSAHFMEGNGKLSTGKLVGFLMDEQNRAYLRPHPGFERPLKDVAAFLNAMPVKTVEEKQAVAFLTTTSNAFGVKDSQVNLAVLLRFVEKVDQTQPSGPAAERAQRVLKGLLGAITQEPGSLNGLSAADLTGFFREPANRAAVIELLNTIDTKNLPPQARDMLAVLHGKGASDVVNALTDQAAAEAFLKAMQDHIAHKKAEKMNPIAALKYNFAQPVVKEALDELRALQDIAGRDYSTVPKLQVATPSRSHK